MNLPELAKKGVLPLAMLERLKAHDWIEWMAGVYTQVDPRSLYVGKPVCQLRPVHVDGRFSPAHAFRNRIAGNAQQLDITMPS
jgi:hypothetical protein